MSPVAYQTSRFTYSTRTVPVGVGVNADSVKVRRCQLYWRLLPLLCRHLLCVMDCGVECCNVWLCCDAGRWDMLKIIQALCFCYFSSLSPMLWLFPPHALALTFYMRYCTKLSCGVLPFPGLNVPHLNR